MLIENSSGLAKVRRFGFVTIGSEVEGLGFFWRCIAVKSITELRLLRGVILRPFATWLVPELYFLTGMAMTDAAVARLTVVWSIRDFCA